MITESHGTQDARLYEPAERLKPLLVPNLFAQFTALANEHKAANLGQGFPSFGSPDFLKKAVSEAMAGDIFADVWAPESLGNQYTRPGGDPALAEVISQVYSSRFGRKLDPLREVVTTIGAQEGLFTTLFALTNPDDEVVLLTPCFDAVIKSASAVGLTMKGVPMRPTKGGDESAVASSLCRASDWKVDLHELDAAITPRTRILMLNTPSSPLGKVFSFEEMSSIAAVVRRHPRLLVLADEVYERCVYDHREHVHFGSIAGMFERTISLFSAGKTFSCTGWRVGYAIAPPQLAAPLLASHAAVNFCVPTPLQKGIAAAFRVAEEQGYFMWLPKMMEGKRDALVKVLQEVGFKPVVPDGGYFVLCDATVALQAANIPVDSQALCPQTALDDRPDVQVCKWLTKEVGVTAIPVSPFFLPEERHLANSLIRFAFCKDEATLSLAAERLRLWHSSLNGIKNA